MGRARYPGVSQRPDFGAMLGLWLAAPAAGTCQGPCSGASAGHAGDRWCLALVHPPSCSADDTGFHWEGGVSGEGSPRAVRPRRDGASSCPPACQELLRRMKGQGFPWSRLLLVLLVFAAGFVLHDIRMHGSFQGEVVPLLVALQRRGGASLAIRDPREAPTALPVPLAAHGLCWAGCSRQVVQTDPLPVPSREGFPRAQVFLSALSFCPIPEHFPSRCAGQLGPCVPGERPRGQTEPTAPAGAGQRFAQGMSLLSSSLLLRPPAPLLGRPAGFAGGLAEGLPLLPPGLPVSGSGAGGSVCRVA